MRADTHVHYQPHHCSVLALNVAELSVIELSVMLSPVALLSVGSVPVAWLSVVAWIATLMGLPMSSLGVLVWIVFS